jgi:hypothetical protein
LAELIEQIGRDIPPPPLYRPEDWSADLEAVRRSVRLQYMFAPRVISPHAMLKITSLGSGS